MLEVETTKYQIMEISCREEKQTLEDFLEEDLPFLIQSQYEATLTVLKQKLQLVNSSLDLIVFQYPNFLERIKYHLFFFFARQISMVFSNNHEDYDFYSHYCLVASTYKNQYIYSFVDGQISDRKIQEIIHNF